jgi:hypothetical protein
MRLPGTDDTSALKMIMTRRNILSVLHWEVPFANEVPRYGVVSQEKKRKKKEGKGISVFLQILRFAKYPFMRPAESLECSILQSQVRKSGHFCNFKISSGHRRRDIRACSIPCNESSNPFRACSQSLWEFILLDSYLRIPLSSAILDSRPYALMQVF